MNPLLPTLCYVVSPRGLSQKQIVVRHDLGLVFSVNHLESVVIAIVQNYIGQLLRAHDANGHRRLKYSAKVIRDRVMEQDGSVYRVITIKISAA